MSLDATQLEIALLDGDKHRREAFSCGERSLDEYLWTRAGQDSRRDAATIYVLVDSAERSNILGYFTLSALSVQLEKLPTATMKRLANYPEVSALLIGRLAVAKVRQGTGLGGELLRRSLLRCIEVSTKGAAAALVVVDSLNAGAAAFYAKYGFVAFDGSSEYPKRLYIPMSTLRKGVS